MKKLKSPITAVKEVEKKAVDKFMESSTGKKILSVEGKESVPIPSEPITCLNCGMVHQNRYCPNCGQRSNIKRFNWKGVFENMTKGLLNTDRGFLFTIKSLFVNPGRVIKNYIDGARVKYFPPFPSMFIIAGFYALIKKFSDFTHGGMVPKKLAELDPSIAADITKETGKDANATLSAIGRTFDFIEEFFGNNLGLLMLLATPLVVLSIRCCFGKSFRKKYNWAETYIISAFVNTQDFVVLSVLAIAVWIFPGFEDNSNTVAAILFLILLVWDMRPFAVLSSNKSAIWRSISAYLLFIFFVVVAIIILAIIAVALYLIISGEKGFTFEL